MSEFVHLHLHSDYSLLDGIGTCEEYGELCTEQKSKYLCVTDHGMMAAVPAQTKVCGEFGLEPIYAIEPYVNDYHHLVPNFKDLSDEDKKLCRYNHHLCMFAMNEEGYKNLVRLSSDAWINGFYYKPRMSFEKIKEHSEGVIVSSACMAGEIPKALEAEDKEKARKVLKKYQDVFGDRFYLEIMLLDSAVQAKINQGIVELAQEEDCRVILTNDVHYARPEDAEAQKVALLINSREGTISNPKGLIFDSQQLWYKSESEIDSMYERHYKGIIPQKIYKESKLETVKLAERCKGVKLDLNPKIPEIENAYGKLMKLIDEAMVAKGFRGNEEYEARLENELSIIREKGFASYFLITRDIINYAKSDLNSIVGPGRGSGPGFLVNYLLKISTVDPIKYRLLSERFLSPHRGGKFLKLKFTAPQKK